MKTYMRSFLIPELSTGYAPHGRFTIVPPSGYSIDAAGFVMVSFPEAFLDDYRGYGNASMQDDGSILIIWP